MFEIVSKKMLNNSVCMMEVAAPFIAAKARAGQFIIFRVDEKGERVPLTIADYNRDNGTITLIFQMAGNSTQRLTELNEGEAILDLVGPLGTPTHIDDDISSVCVIGGGVGCAIAYPQAKSLFSKGINVDVIAGFRNKDIVILENEFTSVSNELTIATDDGSYGTKGFVTDILRSKIKNGKKYDLVIAIGPLPMMKFVCELTKEFNIKTIVSLNPIMIDGTGMCGGCRVRVGGEIKYACIDGPDFDGHQVDFDTLMKRNSTFKKHEDSCRLMNKQPEV